MKQVSFRFKHHLSYTKEIIGFLCILLGIYFLVKQKHELISVNHAMQQSNWFWLAAGGLSVVVYVWLQALMYTSSFRAVGEKINLRLATKLFLKRNLVSVFLPGGGVTSLAFFTSEIEHGQGVKKSKINFASYIYGLIGIGSIVVLAVPVILLTSFGAVMGKGEWIATVVLIGMLALLTYASISIYRKHWVYQLILKYFPAVEHTIAELRAGYFSIKQALITVFYSFLIEAIGIVQLYVAMLALGVSPSWEIAAFGYVISTLLLCISPFMRGLGAVEISLVYILSLYQIDKVEALSITFLYRLFEFWLPLLLGVIPFLFNKGNLILRAFPPILIFLQGLTNIIGVLRPEVPRYLKPLAEFIPTDVIHLSGHSALLIGLMSIICTSFLFKGLKNAWYFALSLSIISLLINLTMKVSYASAALALFSILILFFTRKQYYIKGVYTLKWETIFGFLSAILIYGTVGFFFLQHHHFKADFTLGQSFMNTLMSLSLFDTAFLQPETDFGLLFIRSLNILGIVSFLGLFYLLIRPFIFKTESDDAELERAQTVIKKYGTSSMDYFKTYTDKFFFFSEKTEGMIAYKVANSYAVVLHEPVCPAGKENMQTVILEFQDFCRTHSLKPSYYRVDEKSLPVFTEIGLKHLFIGQEALVDVNTFTLEGKDRKSMRNALNSVQKKGFIVKRYEKPSEGLLQKLRVVSDGWLKSTERREIRFSQGEFNEEELKQQTILTIENQDEKVIAFLNIIPDYDRKEITYDLIRKTEDAPGGVMDTLIVSLIEYVKEQQVPYLNMGLAPLSGLEKPKDVPHRTIKFCYEKLQQFKHYKGLREFKDKFNPSWENKYLVYANHYDLLQIPVALNRVMKN